MSERPEGEQCGAAAVVGCGPLVHGGDAWWQVLGTEVLVARALPQQVAHGWAHFHGGTVGPSSWPLPPLVAPGLQRWWAPHLVGTSSVSVAPHVLCV